MPLYRHQWTPDFQQRMAYFPQKGQFVKKFVV